MVRTIWSWLVVSAFFATPLAHAQAVADEDARVLDEIIVTATLREVALQDLPMSVGVLTESLLDDINALNIEDIWRLVPSVAVRDAPFGGHSVAIRGLVDSDSFLSTESINAFYVDDTAITYAPGLFSTVGNVAVLDLNRVEVLRGPQGTLIGANSMGGAVRMISNEPDIDARTGQMDANLSSTDYGDWNYGARVMLNLPVGSDSALRFAGLYQDDGGFVDDIFQGTSDFNDMQRAAGRLSWLWNASDDVEVLARFYAENLDSGGYNYADPIGRDWVGLLTTDKYQVIRYSDEPRDEDLRLASLRLRWQFDWGELYSATSWYEKDIDLRFDFSPELFFFLGLDGAAPYRVQTGQRDISQEIRLTSSDSARLKWLVGFYWLDQDASRLEVGSAPTFGLDLLDSSTDSKREDIALFGELGWQITDNLEAAVGARWYQIDRSERTFSGTMFGIGETSAEGRMDDIVPKVSLSWSVADDVMIYGLVSQGFRPGQPNGQFAIETCGAREVLDPDSITNYELGIKSQFANRRVSLNATAFHIDWDDMQFNAFELTCPTPLLDNLNEAESRGVEVDFNWLATDTFSLQGGFGYNRAKITTGTDNPAFDVPPGTRMPNVPEWTANLAGTWEFQWSEQVAGYVRVDAQYIDSRTTLYDQSPDFPIRESLPSYSLVNARVGAQFDAWSAELFSTNLTNELAELFCCRALWDPAVSRPRTIGLRGSWYFE